MHLVRSLSSYFKLLVGVKPTQSTELRIAYDKEALYIAVWAFDTESSPIVSQLNRRDNLNNSDRIRFYIDSQHDHQTAFGFGTNPSSGPPALSPGKQRLRLFMNTD